MKSGGPYFCLTFLLIVVLSGCASGPTISSMVATHRSAAPFQVKATLFVSEVSGGETTNPMLFSKIDNESFRDALYQSLQRAQFYRKTVLIPPADYRLDAQIISQELKSGINMTATLMVRYELHTGAPPKRVWAENIFSQHEALFEETFYGNKRAQLAIEGVAKKNIALFLEKLAAYIHSKS